MKNIKEFINEAVASIPKQKLTLDSKTDICNMLISLWTAFYEEKSIELTEEDINLGVEYFLTEKLPKFADQWKEYADAHRK